MTKTLNQVEIDALFNKAQSSGKAARGASGKKVVPYDLRVVNRMTVEEVAAVTTLHESFARRLTDSLAAYLRSAFEMNLVSAEQLTYREFTSRLPELTYFASLHVMPIDARVAIQFDLALAYPIIDALLGGSGTEPVELRDLTEIEEQVFETIVGLIMQELRTSWASVLRLDFNFEQRQRAMQVHQIMWPQDKILCLSFEARLGATSGSLAMVFPAVISNALLRRLSVQGNVSARIPSRTSRRRVCDRLLDSRFMTDLSLPGSPLSIRQLIDLEPGKILTLSKGPQQPVHLNVAGRPMFLAYPVRQGTRRAARVEKRISLVSSPASEQH